MGRRRIVVNSHVRNAAALSELLASLRAAAGFDDAEIVVVVGGHAADAVEVRGNVTRVAAAHNSIDMTALIALLEVFPDHDEDDSYFYIHDTCHAGPRFLELVAALDAPSTASFAFPSMNIGLYPRAALQRHRDLVLSFRNADLSTAAAMRAKADAVAREDAVFRAEGARHTVLPAGGDARERVGVVYAGGLPRRTRHFPRVDLYKHQANWDCASFTLAL